jgi:ankyrin repeat protein
MRATGDVSYKVMTHRQRHSCGRSRTAPILPWGAGAFLLFLALSIPTGPAVAAYVNNSWDWQLFEAIAAGDTRRVEDAAGQGADVNQARNSQGESPLMAAAARGDLEVVKTLVQQGADINLEVPTGLTSTNALARSIASMKVMMYLIEQGANTGAYGKVEPLLMEISRTSSSTLARYLLIKGASVNETNAVGWTPLMNAVTSGPTGRGNPEMVRLLVEWGANVNHRDSDGLTVLMRTTDPHIAVFLLDRGAELGATDRKGNTVLTRLLESSFMKEAEMMALARLFLEKGADPNALDGFKRTPLMIAIWNGSLQIASLLLEKGADTEVRDAMGVTAISVAAEAHDVEMMKLLIARKAEVNSRDLYGFTPLMHLFNGLPCEPFDSESLAQVELLLAAGADLNLSDANDRTLLDILQARGCKGSLIDYLAGKGAVRGRPKEMGGGDRGTLTPPRPAQLPTAPPPPKAKPAPLPSPPAERSVPETAKKTKEQRLAKRVEQLSFLDRRFFLALTKRDMAAMDEALAQGVVINTQSEYLPEETFLMYAVKSKDFRVVAYLLSKGADANLRDLGGMTPLSAAVGNKVVMKLLLARGAEINALSPGEEVEETALALAVKAADAEGVKLLISLGADVQRRDSSGTPPLVHALSLPDLNIAKLLVEAGADVNTEIPGEWTTPLMNAVVINDRRAVEFLVGYGADVNAKNIRGYNALLLAVELAERSIIELILNKSADVNLSGYGGTTPLIESIMLNRGIPITKLLIDRGADVDLADDNGISPLILAVIKKQKAVISLLIDSGANVNQADRKGKLPLQYARDKGGDPAVETILVAAGASDDPRTAAGAKRGVKPEDLLIRAVVEGNLAKARQLLGSGVKINIRDEETKRPLMALAVSKGHRDMVDLLFAQGADLNDAGTTTTLHVAVETANRDMVEHLLKRGARINILSVDGASSLHTAVRLGCVAELGALVRPEKKKRAELFREIATLLIDQGADINAGTLESGDLGEDSLWNPLHLAAYLGSPSMTELLLHWGGQVDSRTAMGNTPLHLAVLTLSGASVSEVVDHLLNRGGNPNDKNKKGNGVLHEALAWWDSWQGWGTTTVDGVARPRWLTMVEKLLEGRASVNEAGEYGVYPIHAAAESGLVDLASLLLERGSSTGVTDRDGNTPLFLAVRQNRLEMVEFLLRKGVNRNSRNREGMTPLDEADYQVKQGAPRASEIRKMLLASGAERGTE